jgi:hypothetical protein
MRSPVIHFWLILCVVAQVVCCAVPPGATVCVKSLLTPTSGATTLGCCTIEGQPSESDACEDCCCECEAWITEACSDEDEDRSPSEEPSRGPCRDRECSLCVKSFHAIPPARGVEQRTGGMMELAPWSAVFFGATGILPTQSRCGWQRPPPDLHRPRQCDLVGSVILQV